MTHEEEAQILVDKFRFAREDGHEDYVAKQCALICVDETIQTLYKINNIEAENQNTHLLNLKQAIEKL